MKKILSIISILSLVVLLCGCDKTDSGKIKIGIGFWPEASQASDIQMFNEWKEAFEKDNPEYEIVEDPYTYSPETVAAKGNQGLLPTIFQTYFTEPQKLKDEKFIRPITKELTELGWLDKMDDSMRAQLTIDGEIYGVPRDGYGLGLYINLALAYDAGLIEKDKDNKYVLYDEDDNPLYPQTFDDITSWSRTIQETYDNKYGIIILSANNTGGWQLSNMAWNFGCGDIQKQENGRWVSNFNDPGMVKALEWIEMMSTEELCYPGASLNYSEWPTRIGTGDVLMAFVGNDAVSQPITSYNFNKDDFALVPMPTGDGESRYALFGGTPYVFSADATDEQVMGALKFLHYIGRCPEVDEITISAMEKGYSVSQAKGTPILPTIKPWKNPEYLELANELESKNINVNYEYMKDFFDTIYDMRRKEEPNFCQQMYDCLDKAIQTILDVKNKVSVENALLTQNSNFQRQYLDKLNK